MKLNGIRPLAALPSTNVAGSRPQGSESADRGDTTRVERPSVEPMAGGVRGTPSNSSPTADSNLIRERSSEDRPGDALEATAQRPPADPPALPIGSRLSIDVDPKTRETRFQLRDRETGAVIREVPERDLRELIQRGVYAQGDLLDRTF